MPAMDITQEALVRLLRRRFHFVEDIGSMVAAAVVVADAASSSTSEWCAQVESEVRSAARAEQAWQNRRRLLDVEAMVVPDDGVEAIVDRVAAGQLLSLFGPPARVLRTVANGGSRADCKHYRRWVAGASSLVGVGDRVA